MRKLETRVAINDDHLAFFRKIAWALAVWAFGMLGSGLYIAHSETQIEDAVVGLQKNIGRINTAVVAMQKDFGLIEGAIVSLQANFADFKSESKANFSEMRADLKARDKQFGDSLDRIEKAVVRARPDK